MHSLQSSGLLLVLEHCHTEHPYPPDFPQHNASMLPPNLGEDQKEYREIHSFENNKSQYKTVLQIF